MSPKHHPPKDSQQPLNVPVRVKICRDQLTSTQMLRRRLVLDLSVAFGKPELKSPLPPLKSFDQSLSLQRASQSPRTVKVPIVQEADQSSKVWAQHSATSTGTVSFQMPVPKGLRRMGWLRDVFQATMYRRHGIVICSMPSWRRRGMRSMPISFRD